MTNYLAPATEKEKLEDKKKQLESALARVQTDRVIELRRIRDQFPETIRETERKNAIRRFDDEAHNLKQHIRRCEYLLGRKA